MRVASRGADGVRRGGSGGNEAVAALLPSPGGKVVTAVTSSLLVASFYVATSALLVLLNKVMPYTYEFTATNFLLLMQMLLTAGVLNALKLAGVVDFERATASNVLRVWPITFFYVLNAAVSLVAVRFLNLAAYAGIKRLTPLFILPVDVWVRGVRVHARLAVACAIIVVGTTLMARFDATSPLFGYALGLGSCASQATYMVYVKQRGAGGLSSLSMLYLHSCISIPLLAPLVAATGELGAALAYPRWTDVTFVLVLLAWPLCGCLLNYALFLCTTVTSPMTTSIAGHIKGALLTLAGFFVFEGATVTTPFLSGLALNLCGSTVYVYDKYAGIRRDARKEDAEHGGGGDGGGGDGDGNGESGTAGKSENHDYKQ